MLLACAFLLGVVAGLRAMMAPAVTSWFARSGVLAVASTPLAFMGFRYAPIILTVLGVGELINDKLPKTPSRKAPPSFIVRILSGGLTGATIGAAGNSLLLGLILGAIGAVAGTLGGAVARARLAAALRRDLPAALVEDVVAIAIAPLCLWKLV